MVKLARISGPAAAGASRGTLRKSSRIMNTKGLGSTWLAYAIGLVLFLDQTRGWLRGQPAIPPAYGTNIHLAEKDFTSSRSFTLQDRLVGTYYFYWYSTETGEHIRNGDGSDALTDHPARTEGFSYRSAAWHKQQLKDMIAAGIDVVLPVFWGAPSEQDPKAELHWSYPGVEQLVKARDELLREGQKPPRVGLFYDTSTLQHNAWHQHIDLTGGYGQQWFYATVRDFFSMVPPRHWAMIDGKPIVLLYAAAFAKNHDQGFIDFTKREFAREFGGRTPWIAAEVSWAVQADSKVAWGGALGLKNPGVASLGPGYDHSAVPGRTPLIVKREDGAFYARNWQKFLRRPSHFVMVETWNEFHEGTDVAESHEYGRRYIDQTRLFADRFKQGWKPSWPTGPFLGARSVELHLAAQNQERGLRLVENEDGRTIPASVGGSQCRAIQRVPKFGSYLYFAADDSFKSADPSSFVLEVECFDAAAGALTVEFDGSQADAPFSGAYSRAAEVITLSGDKGWKTARFTLRDARFLNSQNGNADLRLAITAPEFMVRRVVLSRSTVGQ
jgi:hypothetical protein